MCVKVQMHVIGKSFVNLVAQLFLKPVKIWIGYHVQKSISFDGIHLCDEEYEKRIAHHQTQYLVLKVVHLAFKYQHEDQLYYYEKSTHNDIGQQVVLMSISGKDIRAILENSESCEGEDELFHVEEELQGVGASLQFCSEIGFHCFYEKY